MRIQAGTTNGFLVLNFFYFFFGFLFNGFLFNSSLNQGGSQILAALDSPGGLVKTQLAGPHPRVSDSVSLGRGLRICISTKVPVMQAMWYLSGDHSLRTTALSNFRNKRLPDCWIPK